MRRRKETIYFLFVSLLVWCSVVNVVIWLKTDSLFNNSFLNADEAVGALPIYLYAKEILCTLSWGLVSSLEHHLLLCWASWKCWIDGPHSNSSWPVRNEELVIYFPALQPLRWDYSEGLLYILLPKFLSRTELQKPKVLSGYELTLQLSFLTHLFPHPPPGISQDYLPNKLSELESISGSASEGTQTRTCSFFLWKLEMIISILRRYCETCQNG